MPVNRIEFGAWAWDFVRISGYPDLPGQNLIKVEKDGVDGVAFIESEFRAESTPIYPVALAVNAADMQTWVANMKNLQGTQVLLYTATGLSYNGVVIERVSHLGAKYQGQALWYGGVFPNSYLLRWEMTVRYPYGSF